MKTAYEFKARITGRASLNAGRRTVEEDGCIVLATRFGNESDWSADMALLALERLHARNALPAVVDELAIAIVRQNPPQMAPMGADGGGS